VGPFVPSYVLDTSLLLGGREPPRDGPWATTPEAAAEIQPGGRDARRFEAWLAVGLQVRDAPPEARARVEAAATKAGTLARLSPADLSLLALALDRKAILVTDDYTVLDVAARLGLATQTVNQPGIARTLDFQPRCSGCGRWFEAPQKGDVCPVCGSPVKDKPRTPRQAGSNSQRS
jgi:endoribonuclease Nob1